MFQHVPFKCSCLFTAALRSWGASPVPSAPGACTLRHSSFSSERPLCIAFPPRRFGKLKRLTGAKQEKSQSNAGNSAAVLKPDSENHKYLCVAALRRRDVMIMTEEVL